MSSAGLEPASVDPYAAGTDANKLQVFRRVRDEIEAKVKEWVTEYRQQQA